MQTLDFTKNGNPFLVDVGAFDMRLADVTPLPTVKMQSFLNDHGMRIVRKADGFHIGVSPVFDGPEAA